MTGCPGPTSFSPTPSVALLPVFNLNTLEGPLSGIGQGKEGHVTLFGARLRLVTVFSLTLTVFPSQGAW